MDSQQSTRKRDNFSVNYPQSQDVENEGENGEIKRRKLETDPLRIGNILEKIFSFLDAASIKNARQVKKLWSHEGAKMLINKCYVKIPRELREGEMSSRVKVLDDFKAFLSIKSVDVSMIPHIMMNVVDDVELWKYFGVLGQEVKSLKYFLSEDTLKLLPSLLDLTSNLTYLDFRFRVWSIDLILSYIKVLTSFMYEAAEDRKPLVISLMQFYFEDVKVLELFEQFANCNKVMIEEIIITIYPFAFIDAPDLRARISNVISKLVSTSQSVLKTLHLYDCQMYLSLLELPHLPKLTHLNIEFEPKTAGNLQQCKFSPSFRFSEKVPNLNKVEIRYSGSMSAGGFFGNLFEHTGNAPSVKYLDYWDSKCRWNIDPLLQTFPNIEEFKNFQDGCSETMFRSLWQYGRNLKKLDTTIAVRNSNHKAGDLDSILTGFPPEAVEKMRRSRKLVPYTSEKFEKLRVNPSILNLEELETLEIRIDGTAYGRKQFMPRRMFAISGEYALKLLPKDPKIKISVKVSNGTVFRGAESVLKEVSELPNVTAVVSLC